MWCSCPNALCRTASDRADKSKWEMCAHLAAYILWRLHHPKSPQDEQGWIAGLPEGDKEIAEALVSFENPSHPKSKPIFLKQKSFAQEIAALPLKELVC